MRKTSNGLKNFGSIFGLIIFIYILLRIDIKRLYLILINTDLRYIYLCFVLSPLILFIMSLRWDLILIKTGIQASYSSVCISLVKGALLGEITPGKIGEFMRVKFIMKDKIAEVGKVVFSVVVDRIYDLLILVILACISSIVVIKILIIDFPLSIIFITALVFLLFLAFFSSEKKVKAILLPLFKIFVPKRYKESTELHFSEFYDGLSLLNIQSHFILISLSIIIWFFKFLLLFLLTKALRITVPLGYIISIGSIVVLVCLLPITISGFGSREAVFIYFLSHYNISAEFSVSLSFLFLIFGILGIALSGVIVYISTAKIFYKKT